MSKLVKETLCIVLFVLGLTVLVMIGTSWLANYVMRDLPMEPIKRRVGK